MWVSHTIVFPQQGKITNSIKHLASLKEMAVEQPGQMKLFDLFLRETSSVIW